MRESRYLYGYGYSMSMFSFPFLVLSMTIENNKLQMIEWSWVNLLEGLSSLSTSVCLLVRSSCRTSCLCFFSKSICLFNFKSKLHSHFMWFLQIAHHISTFLMFTITSFREVCNVFLDTCHCNLLQTSMKGYYRLLKDEYV